MKWLRRALPWMLAASVPVHGESLLWHPWSDDAFAQARREHKFVFLDLEAGWCHWCHVMDSVTYRDPNVIGELNRHYVAVRVDQDSRPDLAARYEDYGWPATVIYAADGTEIVKKQGYVPPQPMLRLLLAVVADPLPVNYHDAVPEGGPEAGPAFTTERRAALQRQWMAGYDEKAGGWGFSHKFLDWDSLELALQEARGGDAVSAFRARATLALQRRLIDPVWGGVYQYSAGGGWNEPHFEKIMPMQAGDLRIYAQAFAQWGDPADLASAQAILRYMRGFLRSPVGAFYTSQDADSGGVDGARFYSQGEAGRRLMSLPRVDRHIYARENGWAIEALASYAAWTGDRSALEDAIRAARWVVAYRSLLGGGFRHDENDPAGPYLGDTVAMGRAFWSLYEVTGDREWFKRALADGDFLRVHFRRGGSPGFAASDRTRRAFPIPRPEFDENVAVVRFGADLAAATERPEYRDMAANALRWLCLPGVAESRGLYVAGLLLAERESRTDPIHVAVIGPRSDPNARALFAATLRCPASYKLIEFWDRREGDPPSGEDIYPQLGSAAAFVCANGACSSPLFTAPALAARLKKLESISEEK